MDQASVQRQQQQWSRIRHEIEVFDCYSTERQRDCLRGQNDFCAKNHHWNPRERTMTLVIKSTPISCQK